MASPAPDNGPPRSLRRLPGSLIGGLASLRLAVTLLVVLAAVLAWATIIESAHDREYAQWYVYRSSWFVGLLAVLAANILAATLIRFPWKWSQAGFVIAHAGLLVLLVGSIQTLRGGIEGRLLVAEGERANDIVLNQRSKITAHWQKLGGDYIVGFGFDGGPTDWSEDDTLDFGVADGIGIKVLKYYPHARRQTQWAASDAKTDWGALRLEVLAPEGAPVGDEWLGGNAFGSEMIVGPSRFVLLPVAADTMLEDFLKPPVRDELPEQGLLAAHYDGQSKHIPVGENIGKRVELGDLEVEIAEYHPNARPAGGGRFDSAGDQPKNPLVEIRVHTADDKEPIRQIAFAKLPLLNLDGVHGWRCPVKFWYHHPAVTPAPGAEFLQAPDRKLYCRAVVEGAYQDPREVKQGDEIELGAGFKLVLQEYLPRARQEVSFVPVAKSAGGDQLEAAAQVEVLAGDVTQRVWLKRNDDRHGFARLPTPDGSLLLTFGYESLPLGFSLELVDFQREQNPGGMGDASFASVVRLIDEASGIDEERTIAMNQPLTHGKFTFYQSSFMEQPGQGDLSVLSVAYDPGRGLKYAGSLMICAGTFLMFYVRSLVSGKRRRRTSAEKATQLKESSPVALPPPSVPNSSDSCVARQSKLA